MLTVALTGGLCSGKSTVAAMLRALGWPVQDADAVGHAVLAAPAVAAEVARALGPAAIGGDGRPDRAWIAAQVFGAHPDAAANLERLNQILHPRILAVLEAEFARLAAAATPVAAAEAALFIETGMYRRFDRVLVVVCDAPQRIARFQARTGGTREQAEARLRTQLDDTARRAVADYVIDNSGTLAATTAQVTMAAQAVQRTILGACGCDKSWRLD